LRGVVQFEEPAVVLIRISKIKRVGKTCEEKKETSDEKGEERKSEKK